MKNLFLKLILLTLPVTLHAQWAQEFEVTIPRENIYQLNARELNQSVMAGRKHALFYPVAVSELLIPYEPLKDFFESKPNDPVRLVLFNLAKVVSPFKNMKDLYSWLGLHDYPATSQRENPNTIPELSLKERELPMGATLIENEHGVGLTFGCAACHTGDLFGVKVLGLTNRFPRANEFFAEGKRVAPYVNSFMFRDMLKATEGERLMLVQSKEAVNYVGPKPPVVLGLDTSLAQVALSLARRDLDPMASRSQGYKKPRANKLATQIADSKPAVWWNLKYKNRWLSDGSIVSGNPVHTNFLWNEIGRGVDLNRLENWLHQNDQVIKDLTAAVFASKPPRYEDFFGVDAINLEKARRGQTHFNMACARCHGSYQKGWETLGENAPRKDLLANVTLTYHKKTPVRDVGTDPGRYLGMKEFADDLNRLKISKSIGTLVVPQKGYVPPPLDGIWSRWPYFHNNSIPNLCALMTPASRRPKTYYAGPAQNRETDFDQECVGYPLAEKTPASWKKNKDFLYETKKEGLSNSGHDEGIFLKDGAEIFTAQEKSELIEFLKTL